MCFPVFGRFNANARKIHFILFYLEDCKCSFEISMHKKYNVVSLNCQYQLKAIENAFVASGNTEFQFQKGFSHTVNGRTSYENADALLKLYV